MSPTNLPIQLTSFVGREHDLAEIKRLLTTTRLVTLTGVGGCGKTWLALHTASAMSASFADGIWLATWSDAEFIATLRTETTSGGHSLNEEMSWLYFGQMTVEELNAIWAYLQSLPALGQDG